MTTPIELHVRLMLRVNPNSDIAKVNLGGAKLGNIFDIASLMLADDPAEAFVTDIEVTERPLPKGATL